VRRQRVNQLRKAGFVFEDGGDVVEQDSGLGEVGTVRTNSFNASR
jgi:hypothetical protein